MPRIVIALLERTSGARSGDPQRIPTVVGRADLETSAGHLRAKRMLLASVPDHVHIPRAETPTQTQTL